MIFFFYKGGEGASSRSRNWTWHPHLTILCDTTRHCILDLNPTIALTLTLTLALALALTLLLPSLLLLLQCYATVCCAILWYELLCYAMTCCAMLCYTIVPATKVEVLTPPASRWIGHPHLANPK